MSAHLLLASTDSHSEHAPPRTRLTPLRRRRALLIYSLCIFHSVKNMSDEYCVAVIIFMRSEVIFLLLSGVKTSFNVGFGRRGNY